MSTQPLWLKHRDLAIHQAHAIAKACREAEAHAVFERPTIGTAAGDERKLRGIPAIGRSVAGAIPGTTPHSALDSIR